MLRIETGWCASRRGLNGAKGGEEGGRLGCELGEHEAGRPLV